MGWRFILAMPIMAVASWWICTGLIGKASADTIRAEKDCVRYLGKALPAIVNGFDYEEWEKRTARELLATIKPNVVRAQFAQYRKTFRDVQLIEAPIGRVEIDNSGGIEETIGYYNAFVRFKGGTANVAMRLVKRDGGWKFQQFRIRSPLFPQDD